MGCDGCTDKEKKQLLEKLRTDAKKQAQEKGAPVAICEGEEIGYFLIDASEAYNPERPQRVLDVISHLQQTST